MSREIISLKNLFAGYNGRTVLQDINLSIFENDFVGIIGPNGGGKTTLLKIILGLIAPEKGEIKVFGEPPQDARKFIGYVPQNNLFDRQFPISVRDVVLMGRLGRAGVFKKYSARDFKTAEAALETVEMLEFKNRPIGQLSEGQRQRVFIARALAGEPRLLILDEPASSIDEKMQVSLYELLGRLKKELSIILVSHDIGVISQYVDKIACLNSRLFYHGGKDISHQDIEAAYLCPIELIGHGKMPHRVLKEH